MQLQVFNHKDLGQVRVIGDNENPLFCLRDICEVLGLESVNKVANAIKAEFEGGELDSAPLQTKGGIQQATFITEPQLYFVLMRSDKPKAKPFRQWVVNEVLPSIRKNGYYINQNKKTRAKQEQILHNLITELQDSNTQKDCIKQENESLKDEVIALQRKLLALYDNKDKKEVKILPEHYGKRLSEEEKIQILSLREEGKSMREIQEIMQRSEHALYCVLREAKRGVLEYR
ncbi:MAG TPA: antirepressor, BRO family protein [Helicobacter sp.]|nr:antirepressor, BRO family protein [Helicobacter sp.]